MTIALLEELVHELPEAKRRSKASDIGTRDQLEGWILSFRDWTEKFRALTRLLERHWYETSAELRVETVHMVGDWMEIGVYGMKSLNEHSSRLPEAAWEAMRVQLREFMASTLAFEEVLNSVTSLELRRKTAARESSEVQARIQTNHEEGKRQVEAGLGAVYTPEEFKKRFV